MATITTAIRKSHGSSVGLIPAQILKAIPQDELLDRLSHAADLERRAQRPGTDPDLRDGYNLIAKAVLAAQPRETTERAVAEYHVLAARTRDARRAGEMRSAAARILERNPVAPRRADIAKARATDPAGRRVIKGALHVAVYDHRGRVAGLIDPARIVQRVTKADRDAGKAAQVAVYDEDGNLVGIVDPADITPLAVAEPSIGNPADMTPAPPADAGTPADDVANIAKATALKKTLYHGTPAEQNQAATQMNAMAIASLAAIHGRGSQPRGR